MENYGYRHEEQVSDKPYTITRYPSKRNEDYLVEVNSRGKLFKKRKFYRNLSLILLILCLIFLIFLIILSLLYFRIYSPSICTSDECLRSAANLRLSIDFNADPCEDFYKYTCGRWSEEHPNHGWFASFSAFATINERILIATENFLISPSNQFDGPKPVNQTRILYESCMDAESIDRLGLLPVYKYLEEVDLPRVPSIFTKTNEEIINFKFNFLKMEAKIKKIFAMDVFIGFAVEANEYDNTENVMYIGTPAQNCPLPSPFTRRKENDFEELRKHTNEKIIKYVISAIVVNETGEYPDVKKLHEVSQVLVNISDAIGILIENHTTTDYYIGLPHSIIPYQDETNKYLLNTINKEYPNIWEEYLNYIFEETNITIIPEEDLLFASDVESVYLKKVLRYLLTTSDIYLELYMWWVTVYAMIINTSSDIVDYISKQVTPFYSDTNVVRSRSIDCASLVITFMPLAISYGIADKTFNNNTKPKVEQMLYDIKNAFVQRVNGIKWMDNETKKATLEKSKEMISFIGYPEWLFESGALESHYKNIEINSNTYLENMMNLIKNFIPEKLIQLRQLNKRDWKSDPTTVNAFNSFPDNAINVPMAILTFPIYNLGLEVLNYGAIGSVLGHELTHGFDNSGRKHDKFGNYKQWWTNETIDTFEQKTQCFIKQYDNFTIDGVEQHINGEKTLDENIADNGGLGHAYVAYKNYIKKFGIESKLPGFQNFSNDQMFFIAFGSIWCENISLEDLKTQIENDEHSPNRIRVMGTLQNMPEFSKAFHCPKGSKMNPKTSRCLIW